MLNLHLVGVSSVYSILCYVRCLAAGFTSWNENVVVFVGPDTTYVVGVVYVGLILLHPALKRVLF